MVGMPIETRAFAPSFKNGRNKFVSEDRLSRNFAFNISLISKASIVQEDCVASSSVDISQGPGVVSPVGRRVMYRHTLLVRITHWINALCFVFLLMSGLQIFNAHPALYWGNRSDFDRPFLSLNATQTDDGAARGVTTILGRSFTTTGLLGASRDENGQLAERGFPRWITIPSYQDLATGRRWHFFFAWLLAFNGIVYGANFLVRSRWRDFLPAADEWRSIPASLWQHLRLRFPKGDEALHYNVLQKVAYLSVLVVLPVLTRGSDDVAGYRCDVSVPSDAVWRATIGEGYSLPRRLLSHWIRFRPPGHGADLRLSQQHGVHDYRPIRH